MNDVGVGFEVTGPEINLDHVTGKNKRVVLHLHNLGRLHHGASFTGIDNPIVSLVLL